MGQLDTTMVGKTFWEGDICPEGGKGEFWEAVFISEYPIQWSKDLIHYWY